MTETTTQIEAGRELDALVAVEVMGWTRLSIRNPLWHSPSDLVWRAELPAFSTTGDGMLAVLEQMRALGWEFAVYCDPGEAGWSVTIGGALLSRDTLPHAACLAALEAVRA